MNRSNRSNRGMARRPKFDTITLNLILESGRVPSDMCEQVS
ncbi:hypothetical protein [Burkholderia phage BCSR52]|uniref:Uncharacterized protein n=1 Tax=Burkholderia phage BCSR52 TaxID=2805748 RepID=A0A889IQL6_9CAUD|nr:hypothetical protein [Burkholderia phage BCSR52]